MKLLMSLVAVTFILALGLALVALQAWILMFAWNSGIGSLADVRQLSFWPAVALIVGVGLVGGLVGRSVVRK